MVPCFIQPASWSNATLEQRSTNSTVSDLLLSSNNNEGPVSVLFSSLSTNKRLVSHQLSNGWDLSLGFLVHMQSKASEKLSCELGRGKRKHDLWVACSHINSSTCLPDEFFLSLPGGQSSAGCLRVISWLQKTQPCLLTVNCSCIHFMQDPTIGKVSLTV